jgi:signal transduction histidine kinase
MVLVITVATSFIVGRYQSALRHSAASAAQVAEQAATALPSATQQAERTTLEDNIRYENAIVISKLHDANQLASVLEPIQIVGLLVGVIGGFAAMVLFVRSIVRRIGEVDANARRLGVSETLLPIPPAEDEVGHLAQELRQTSELLTERSSDLVRAHGAAVDSADAANQLLSRISHELRTPLTAVMGFGQMIDQSKLDDEDAEAVEQILHGGTHMLRIIEEAKITTQTPRAIDVDLYPVEVGPVVEEVQNLLSPLSAGRHLTVTGGINCGVVVIADYHRFKQVLINLMSNAVKYNVEGGRITISCGPPTEGVGEPNGKVRIAVTDTGDGIPSEMIDRVFVPFDRLDAEERGIEGTGIGLSLSRTFVEAMDGTIGVESKVGVGSTFWVDLPLASSPGSRLSPPGPLPLSGPSARSGSSPGPLPLSGPSPRSGSPSPPGPWSPPRPSPGERPPALPTWPPEQIR